MQENNKTLTKAETETLRQFEDWLDDLIERKDPAIRRQREQERELAIEQRYRKIRCGFYIFFLLFALAAIYLSLNRQADYIVTRWIERSFGAISKRFQWIWRGLADILNILLYCLFSYIYYRIFM